MSTYENIKNWTSNLGTDQRAPRRHEPTDLERQGFVATFTDASVKAAGYVVGGAAALIVLSIGG